MNLNRLKEYVDSALANNKTVTVKTSDNKILDLDSNSSSYSLNIDNVLEGFVGFQSNSDDEDKGYLLVKTESILSIRSTKFNKISEDRIPDLL